MSRDATAAAAGEVEFKTVQALRAVAALTVVAGHAQDFLRAQNGTVPPMFQTLHGPVGVDLFFVISGLVMAVSARRLQLRPHSARLFLLRRLVRIVPLYWLLTLLKYGAVQVRPSLSAFGRIRFAELGASLLFLPYRTPDGLSHPIIPVAWTLSFEMLFYLLFAVSMMVRGGLGRVLVPALLLLAAADSLRAPTWPVWTALLNPIVLEFLAGVGIGVLVMRRRLVRGPMAMLLLVAGGLFLVLTDPTVQFAARPLMRPLVWGVGAGAVVLGAVSLEASIAPWLPRWLLLLGDASYSIYLVQGFVYAALHRVLAWGAPGLVHRRPVVAGAALLLAGVLCTALVGFAVYRWVEAPMTRALRGWASAARPLPVAP